VARDLIFLDLEKIDAFETELDGPLTELVDGELFIAPAAHGLADAGLGGFLLRWKIESRRQRYGGCGLKKYATGRHGNQRTADNVSRIGVREQLNGEYVL
jgi:hypothetical protein